jgi:hypothetical protein
MSTQVWLPKDAEQLKELREAAQTDISILARMYSLSITQIKQLEDGGESSFYSPAIKYATGRKLLMHFGVDITEIKEKGVKKQEFASLNNPKNIFIQNEIKESYKFFRWELLTKILLILLCVLFLVNSFSSLKNIASQIFFADNQLLSPVVKKNAIEISSQFTPPSKFSDVKSLPSAYKKFECDWEGLTVPINTIQPIKPGNYVHLVAKENADICVSDYTGETSIFQMKNTQTLTVKGIQPFQIYGTNLNAFKIYYQGKLLKLPQGDISRITLKEQNYE